jgi:molybdate transport system substrate-binding protein
MTTTGSRRAASTGLVAVAVALALALAVATLGCSSSSVSSPTNEPPPLSGTITVSAASSLTTVFTTLATTFEGAHHGTAVTFNFGSSGALATQIVQGASADVFASAARAPMAKVQAADELAGAATIFARNRLEIVVKPGNPLGIHGLNDLAKAHVVALCVATAPCGSTAAEALARANLTLPVSAVTRGQDVDATLSQVTTGDADAAVVYATNAVSVGTTGTGVPIPPTQNVTTSYPIAVLRSSTDISLARAWVAYVLGPVGTAALRRADFLPPR